MDKFKEYQEFFVPGAILLAGLFIGSSILYTGGVGQGVMAPERNVAAVVEPGNQPTDTVHNNGTTVDFTITEGDHMRGNPDAGITLVEFSDFECPFCGRFHPTAEQALQEYGDDIRWVYKHFPLDSIHPQARAASEASECVWEQQGDEGFWEFANAMFAGQDSLSSAFYRQTAQQLGVNISQFDTCVSDGKYKEKVDQQHQEGLQAGVSGTPGSFVNGVPVRGAVPYSQLKTIIDSQL